MVHWFIWTSVFIKLVMYDMKMAWESNIWVYYCVIILCFNSFFSFFQILPSFSLVLFSFSLSSFKISFTPLLILFSLWILFCFFYYFNSVSHSSIFFPSSIFIFVYLPHLFPPFFLFSLSFLFFHSFLCFYSYFLLFFFFDIDLILSHFSVINCSHLFILPIHFFLFHEFFLHGSCFYHFLRPVGALSKNWITWEKMQWEMVVASAFFVEMNLACLEPLQPIVMTARRYVWIYYMNLQDIDLHLHFNSYKWFCFVMIDIYWKEAT